MEASSRKLGKIVLRIVAKKISIKKLLKQLPKSIEEAGYTVSNIDESFQNALQYLIKKSKVTVGEKYVISVVEGTNTSDIDVDNQLSKKQKCDVDLITAMPAAEIATLTEPKHYDIVPQTGNTTILLFYAYCEPPMTRSQQDDAISRCYGFLNSHGMSGRLRVGREGFNSTLTGSYEAVREFTAFLREFMPGTFGNTDFKYVDGLPDSQLLKGLKVWPVTEIVTYGFDPSDAPLDMRGTHLKPHEFHDALAEENSILIDVRNFNETLIGKFAPPGSADKVLDPLMRRSTEFPGWVDDNKYKFEGKKVLMCCTAGVRCERASALMRMKGVQNVYQLEGGIHRYLDAYPKDGGFWVGKNYTFDKRFSHGAENATVVSECVYCSKPWERYQAQKKCFNPACKMEVLLCRDCQRSKPSPPSSELFCPLCKPKFQNKKKRLPP